MTMTSQSAAENYLDVQKRSNDIFAEDWQIIEKYYLKKLWHQLTLKLLEFVNKEAVFQSNVLVDGFYENFLSDFEHIINPLAMSELVLVIVKKMRSQADKQDAIPGFVEKIRDKVLAKAKDGTVAVVLCNIALATFYLEDRKDNPAARKLMEEAGSKLQEFDYVTPVHDRYFALTSAYHRTLGNHAEYYREALRYLGCTKLENMPVEERRAWASTVAVAALLGKGVYNFGELLMHEVLTSLDGTEQSWLVQLLYAFNKGDIAAFAQLRPRWSGQPDLAKQEQFLKQKVTLMCLIELAFKRPTTQRQISFAEISQATMVPVEEVEYLLMRALSLDLIRGKINEVDKLVHVTWVQPRVLDVNQLASVQRKLTAWVTSAAAMEEMMRGSAGDGLMAV
ncbi:hypothetical protein BOX15_Mlig007595g3 [Macrostomum lignano]|uniref:26S proteasome non-ATPase regulatory subunit 13 n=2 Tax=Macrostomum lignano TaxID=282301 RepID=A0A1I8HSV5_9PLAT|nr:hypothetical protein BOX15_Mlig007595g3 [Macrostomum lignano]